MASTEKAKEQGSGLSKTLTTLHTHCHVFNTFCLSWCLSHPISKKHLFPHSLTHFHLSSILRSFVVVGFFFSFFLLPVLGARVTNTSWFITPKMRSAKRKLWVDVKTSIFLQMTPFLLVYINIQLFLFPI